MKNPFVDYMTISEASRFLGFHENYVRRLCKNEKLRAVQFGREWAVLRKSVHEYKKAREGLSKYDPTPVAM